MSKKYRPVEVGDRFETRDSRDAGRIVEVVEIVRDSAVPENRRYKIRTEVNPKNPFAVGHFREIGDSTLRLSYRRVSR